MRILYTNKLTCNKNHNKLAFRKMDNEHFAILNLCFERIRHMLKSLVSIYHSFCRTRTIVSLIQIYFFFASLSSAYYHYEKY